MSITSPIPVLRGDKGTELRSEGEELLLRRPDDELRIPLAAIARVRAERRDVAVELTAPAGAEPTVYRVEDVSGAAAAVFADAVNGALPERPAGEEAVDGSTLVTTRSLRAADDDEEEEEGEDGGPNLVKRAALVAGVALVALCVVVGIAGEHVGRAIATLLLGALGVAATFAACAAMLTAWESWYLPRYGITVDARQIFLDGNDTYAYTDTSGVTRPVYSPPKGDSVRVAYHPHKPKRAVVCRGWGGVAGDLALGSFVLAVAALIDYGTVVLVLPAFGG
ncbi:hypothetical protein [Streptomyces sp. NPDC018000]|uniref:hypothetical protein n=1 Tax=Streptomyces sp. NPDC018000 TaxID=3365028 RepID=UPI00378A6E43